MYANILLCIQENMHRNFQFFKAVATFITNFDFSNISIIVFAIKNFHILSFVEFLNKIIHFKPIFRYTNKTSVYQHKISKLYKSINDT